MSQKFHICVQIKKAQKEIHQNINNMHSFKVLSDNAMDNFDFFKYLLFCISL